jgi:hypothetical protein
MWNIPYIFACLNPLKHVVSLYQAISMQFIGFLGESIIFFQLPEQHTIIRHSVGRFILFDGLGLTALVLSFFIIRNKIEKEKDKQSDKITFTVIS